MVSEEDYRKALISITEYMGKVPKLPNQIMGIKESDIPYYANYDRFAEIIRELGKEYKRDNWIKSAELFDKCGKNIETIVTYVVQYCNDTFFGEVSSLSLKRKQRGVSYGRGDD